jgi:hypothetical protein
MTTTVDPGSRALAMALVLAESCFVVRACEGGETQRCAFGQVALLRRLFDDPGERLEAYARLLGLEAARIVRAAS